MRKAPAGPPTGVRAPLFAISAALSLLVALICALLPTGPQSSANPGSAFSPSTTAVSLSAPRRARIVGNRVEANGDSEKSVPSDQLRAEADVRHAPPTVSGSVSTSAPDPDPILPEPYGRAWPRAPPAA